MKSICLIIHACSKLNFKAIYKTGTKIVCTQQKAYDNMALKTSITKCICKRRWQEQ